VGRPAPKLTSLPLAITMKGQATITGQPGEGNMKRRAWASVLLGILSISLAAPVAAWTADPAEERFRTLREEMVRRQIQEPPDYRDPVKDKPVLSAMRTVPRHLFVNAEQIPRAYGDHPLPIGFGQTISQPYIVALMTAMLEISPEHRVLEVGTGSGYQAAILSALVEEVYTVEIIEPLGTQAADRLKGLGYENVHVKTGDGYFGWEEKAPFDRIIVTCAASLVPPPLLRQLKPGGKMCIPVGGRYTVQYLTMVEKSPEGSVIMTKTIPVRFVPLVQR
jgi:protein-L-isoaspartate(D-aspartate) O-methyltransferase